MAVHNIELPEIGEGVNEGELVHWIVQPGDKLEVDQPIAELMTDKATVEVPTPLAGTVMELNFSEGDNIEVGQALITLEVSETTKTKEESAQSKVDKEKTEGKGLDQTPGTKTTPPMSSNSGLPSHQGQPNQMETTSPISLDPTSASSQVLASPFARRLARENKVDIYQVTGTGLSGRVTAEDVLKVSSPSTIADSPETKHRNIWELTPPPKVSVPTMGAEERVPLRGIRKKIAENMQMAKRVIPHFTLMDEANLSSLVRLRQELKPTAEEMGVKVTYLPFVMKALMITIGEFPKFNASIDDTTQEIVYKKYFNIGFATDTPKGLLVPVIKNADQKTIYQLSREIGELAIKARQGQLGLDEMKGACFTITNIGSIGGICATPIINPPEVSIFGMYRLQKRPIIKDGSLEEASFMNFTVTCDHRLIDGAEAARFLSAFLARMENPGRLLMDMI